MLRKFALLTFVFFIYFTLNGNMALQKDEDILLKARMLIQDGDFEGAVNELNDVVKKLKDLRSQKRNLAEGYYLLARVYKIIQMENKYIYHLNMAFEIYPNLSMEEPDPEIRERVSNIKTELERAKMIAKTREKKKKKFPVLLVLAGSAVAVTVTLLLLKKKSTDDNRNFDTEVLGIQWIDIPAGEFLMGDNFNDDREDEQPVHNVYLDAYKMSKYEVTFEQYDTFCDETNRRKPDDRGWSRETRPVMNVTWDDANAFCDWLSRKTGKNIRIPSEAQWEKAARGTDQRKYPWGNGEPNCAGTNYNDCRGRTMPVGSYPFDVSFYGVYDMAGNVKEWCSDWYEESYYSDSPVNNPTGPATGIKRVHRGGSWKSDADGVRAIDRDSALPENFSSRKGIRICWN
jgi:formylglycine-generating enzyme required for sulfatase activity